MTHSSIFIFTGLLTLLSVLICLYKQFKNRQETFKNFRFRLHLSLMAFAISYTFRLADKTRIIDTVSEDHAITET